MLESDVIRQYRREFHEWLLAAGHDIGPVGDTSGETTLVTTRPQVSDWRRAVERGG